MRFYADCKSFFNAFLGAINSTSPSPQLRIRTFLSFSKENLINEQTQKEDDFFHRNKGL